MTDTTQTIRKRFLTLSKYDALTFFVHQDKMFKSTKLHAHAHYRGTVIMLKTF